MSLRSNRTCRFALLAMLSATHSANAQTAPRFPWDTPDPAPKAATESKPQPSKTQPSKTQPSKAQPSKAQPSKAQPAKAQPSPTAAPQAPAPATADKAPSHPSAKPPVVPPATPAKNSTSADGANSAERRLQQIESALDGAGLLARSEQSSVAPKANSNPERKAQLEAELDKLARQEQSLNAAVSGGLDASAVAGTLEGIRTRRSAIEVELKELQREAVPAPAAPTKPALLQRLDQLEQQLQRTERQLAEIRAAQAAAANATAKPNSDAVPAPAAKQTGAPAASPATTPNGSGYKDGFVLRSDDGNFTLQPNGFVQVRFAYEGFEGADDKVAFSLPRARAGFKGNVFTPMLKYNFLADFGKGTTQLTYFYGDYTFSKDVAGLRAGLFKRPFTRALLSASEKSEFVSSPLTLKAFGEAHDIGVMLHNGTPELEYAFGVFNGTGSKGTIGGTVQVDPMTGAGKIIEGDLNNVPSRLHPLLVGRVAYNDGDVQGYSEGDFDGGPTRFAIGAAGELDLDADDDKASFVRGTLDGVLKAYGFSGSLAGIISSRQAGDEFATRAYEALGLLAQTGYMLSEHVQPALRYTLIAPAGKAPTHEFAAGANLYFHKHALKWQNEFDLRQSEVDDATHLDSAVMSQVQVVF